MQSNSLNKDFIKRAEQFTTFNIFANDLTSVTYKNEVRHIISKNWFPSNKENVYSYELDKTKINDSIHKLKSINKEGFHRLYSYNMKGIGPGEIMLYYLIDGATIGGGSSAGVDISIEGENYEVKAVKSVYNKTLEGQYLNDFKLGGTVNLTEVMQGLQELGKVTKTELPASKVNEIRNTKDFKALEELFRRIAAEYFKEHKIIFLDNGNKNKGEVINISPIEPKNIYIERMTSGTVKPLIKKD